jgi:hypothetical protein
MARLNLMACKSKRLSVLKKSKVAIFLKKKERLSVKRMGRD